MKNYTKKEVNSFGTIRYYNASDKLHRLNGPAIIWAIGDKDWYIIGKGYAKRKHNRLVLFYTLEPQRFEEFLV
jgi:hypothetical protein